MLDGLPPGIPLESSDIQHELDRRRPGQSRVTTSRKEDDLVRIVSGVFEGKTTGTPVALLIENKDHDSMYNGNFVSNHAGGILGGISNGEDIVISIAVKPTPSISQSQETCDIHGNNILLEIDGRHDPCIIPRIIPVVEAMAALVILDLWEIQARLRPGWTKDFVKQKRSKAGNR